MNKKDVPRDNDNLRDKMLCYISIKLNLGYEE